MKVISRILIFIIAVLIIIGSTIYLISDGFKSQKNQLPLLHEWTTEKQASPDLKNMDWNDPLYQSWMIINLLNDTLSPEEEHCAIDFLNEASLQNNLNEVLTNLLNYKAKQKSALYYLIARWNETYAQSDKKYFEDYINNIFGVQKTLNNPSKRFTISMLLRAILLDTTLTYENAKAVISTHQLVFVNNPE
nr:hypothetical protein [Bacteroidota bacterium]